MLAVEPAKEYRNEDVGNIVLLEHVNVCIPDQALGTLFYIVGMGFTRDPHMMVGLDNMWVNIGEQQFHLPTGNPQVLPGHVGVVVPDLQTLQQRLESVRDKLSDTQFSWSVHDDHVHVTSPWGKRVRCYGPDPKFGAMKLGVPYVEFRVRPGAAEGIGRFYERVMGAPVTVDHEPRGTAARVHVGQHQTLVFQDTAEEQVPYDGHHVAIYIANFSAPYAFFKERGLITKDVTNHEFRFQTIVDPETDKPVYELEHEVRSMRHPRYRIPLVNRTVK